LAGCFHAWTQILLHVLISHVPPLVTYVGRLLNRRGRWLALLSLWYSCCCMALIATCSAWPFEHQHLILEMSIPPALGDRVSLLLNQAALMRNTAHTKGEVSALLPRLDKTGQCSCSYMGGTCTGCSFIVLKTVYHESVLNHLTSAQEDWLSCDSVECCHIKHRRQHCTALYGTCLSHRGCR
jgi:hypothetical protein